MTCGMHMSTLNSLVPSPESDYAWNRDPIQGAAYAQGKLEFGGMIANIGVRLDYFDANTEWWQFTPYDQALSWYAGRAGCIGYNSTS